MSLDHIRNAVAEKARAEAEAIEAQALHDAEQRVEAARGDIEVEFGAASTRTARPPSRRPSAASSSAAASTTWSCCAGATPSSTTCSSRPLAA